MRAAWEQRFVASGVARSTETLRGDYEADYALTVRPPDGHVLLTKPPRLDAHLAADVVAVIGVVPVIREAVLEVRVSGPDGRAADGASLANVTLGGSLWAVRVEALEPGRMRVYGLPHLAGEVVEATVSWPAAEGVEEPPPLPAPSEGPRALHALVPEGLATPWLVEVQLRQRSNSLDDHVETDNDMPYEETLNEDVGPGAPKGRLRVSVRDLHGRPVLGEPLFGRQPDARGEVLLEELRPGRLELSVNVPGRLPARGEAMIRTDEEVRVTLHEPLGGRLEVTVVDEEGRPRPTAVLQIRGATFFDAEGTTQRADMFTDHLGRRSIARVEPGEAEVHASWGGRHGFEKVTVIDGETTRVRIVAR